MAVGLPSVYPRGSRAGIQPATTATDISRQAAPNRETGQQVAGHRASTSPGEPVNRAAPRPATTPITASQPSPAVHSTALSRSRACAWFLRLHETVYRSSCRRYRRTKSHRCLGNGTGGMEPGLASLLSEVVAGLGAALLLAPCVKSMLYGLATC